MKNKFQTRNLFTAKTLQICCRATLVGVFFFLILFFAVMVTNEEQKGDERSTSEAKWMCGPKMADHRRHRNLWSRVFWRGSDPRNRGACTKKKTKKTQKMEGSAVTPVLAAVESDLIPRPSRHQLDQLVRKSRIPLPPPPPSSSTLALVPPFDSRRWRRSWTPNSSTRLFSVSPKLAHLVPHFTPWKPISSCRVIHVWDFVYWFIESSLCIITLDESISHGKIVGFFLRVISFGR